MEREATPGGPFTRLCADALKMALARSYTVNQLNPLLVAAVGLGE
jgi:hypothetical protein